MFSAGLHARLLVLSLLALAVTTPHAWQPGVIPQAGQRPPGVSILVLMIPPMVVVTGIQPGATAPAAIAAIAAGMLALAFHRMPRSYQLAPTGVAGSMPLLSAAVHDTPALPGSAGGTRALPAPARGTADAAHVHWQWPLFRTLFPLRLVSAVLLLGAMGWSDNWFLYLLILFVPDFLSTERVRWMGTMPVSRTALIWATIGPAVLALFFVLLGSVLGSRLDMGIERINSSVPHRYTRDDLFERRTMVPLAFWQVAPGRTAPTVNAPWGEATATDTITLPGVTLYNPYSVRKGSSPELLEWQFARATAAVHGRSFTTAEYSAPGFSPPLRVTKSVPVYLLAASMVLTFVLLMAWVVTLLRWHALATRPRLHFCFAALGTVIAAGLAIGDLWFMFAHSSPAIVPMGAALAMHGANAMPNVGVVAVVALIPVLLAYALLHWQVEKADKA